MQDKYNKKYRIDLDFEYIQLLQKYLNKIDPQVNDVILFNEMKEIVNNPKQIEKSIKKSIAADTATAARTAKAKEKIQNAINILRMENKKITHYSIAKTAGVSYTTVKKYISINEVA